MTRRVTIPRHHAAPTRGHRLRSLVAIGTAVLVAWLGPTPPASAASHPWATITLDPVVGPPTTTVGVAGTGFGSKEQVQISFSGKLVATAESNKKGSFSAFFDAPKSAKPGKHTVKATGESSGNIATATFRVRTDWVQFRYDPAHSGTNPYENVLSPKNVKKLRVRWTYGFADRESSPAVVGGVAYISAGEYVSAVKATTGKDLWRSPPLGDSVIGTPAVADGRVYASTGNGVDALDAATGKRLWHYQAFEPRAPTVVGGLVYFGSYLGGVYAVDAVTGAKRWLAPTGPILSSPAVVDGVVYIGSDDDSLYAVDAATGAKRWTFPTGDRVESSPSVVDGVVYVGSEDGNVYAIDAHTGAEIWAFPTVDGLVDGAPSVADGVVYIGAYGAIYALRASDGTEVWSEPQTVNILSPPAVANGIVYVGAMPANAAIIAAYRASTGELLWSYVLSTHYSVLSSPAVVNGVVYVGSPDGDAYAFGL
jgi:outer membrane protein assembly factor BamB